MFGKPKRKGLFGNQGQMAAPMDSPLGGLLEGMQVGTGNFAPTAARSSGGIGHILKNIAGHVGDAISQHHGGAAIYGPEQARQQAFEFQTQQQADILRRQSLLQAQRAQDARSLAEYRATLPTAQMKNFDNFQAMQPEEQQKFLRYQDAVNPLGSIGPDGRFYNRPRASQDQVLGSELPSGWTIDEPASPPASQQPLSGYRTINQLEYQQQLKALGGDQRLMNAWMRNNNVIARN